MTPYGFGSWVRVTYSSSVRFILMSGSKMLLSYCYLVRCFCVGGGGLTRLFLWEGPPPTMLYVIASWTKEEALARFCWVVWSASTATTLVVVIMLHQKDVTQNRHV